MGNVFNKKIAEELSFTLSLLGNMYTCISIFEMDVSTESCELLRILDNLTLSIIIIQNGLANVSFTFSFFMRNHFFLKTRFALVKSKNKFSIFQESQRRHIGTILQGSPVCQTNEFRKNFVCKVCGHGSKYKGDLQKHMYIHTGEKPYKCPYCDYASADQSNLKKHTRIKHPPPQFLFTIIPKK